MNSKQNLWQVCITTTPEGEEAAIEALEMEFGAAACSYTDAEALITQTSVYLDSRPANLTAGLNAVRARLWAAKAGGLQTGAATVTCRPLKRVNWAESWKRHFKPLEIGNTLLLKPSWSRRKPKPGQKLIVLDPGLSFGTGQHATTSFCLREVVRFHKRGGGSVLDMGTGSGILAIAAAKLGCKPVEGFDHDPEAVRVAQENARRNRVAHKLRLHEADLTRLGRRSSRRFDLVCANLISNLLVAERERILARVNPGGTLVLAGVLETEFAEVCEAFVGKRMKLVRRRSEREWISGAFVALKQ